MSSHELRHAMFFLATIGRDPKRFRNTRAALLLLLVWAVMVAACGDDGSNSQEVDVLRQASLESAEQTSFDFVFRLGRTDESLLGGSGTYNGADESARLLIPASVSGSGSDTELVSVRNRLYFRGGLAEDVSVAAEPHSGEWFYADLDDPVFRSNRLLPIDPTLLLTAIHDAKNVVSLGSAEIDGSEMARYGASLDALPFKSGPGEAVTDDVWDVDVWVDAVGTVRRVELTLIPPNARIGEGDSADSYSIRVDYHNYGGASAIVAPVEATDATAPLREFLQM